VTKTICILIGNCYSWGKTWKRHWYNKKGYCYRCGIERGDK